MNENILCRRKEVEVEERQVRKGTSLHPSQLGRQGCEVRAGTAWDHIEVPPQIKILSPQESYKGHH